MTGSVTRIPPPDGRPRVFCFHHAGGGASAFAAWPRLLGVHAHVCPVQLPGREGRAAEPRHTTLDSLRIELAEELSPLVGASSVFYGHSMGALVAFAVARDLAEAGRPLSH